MPIYFRFLLSVTAVCLVGCPENITSSGSCVSDSQCEFPKICRDGKCVVQCFLDSECAETAACVYNRCVESASSSDGGADARPVTDSSMTDASQPVTDAGQAIDGSLVDSGVVTSDMAVSSDANASADAQTSSDFGATTAPPKTPRSVTMALQLMLSRLTQRCSRTRSPLTRLLSPML